MKTKSKEQSDAYLEGWKQRHAGTIAVPVLTVPAWISPELVPWFERGWKDCYNGTIDAESALGPELLVEGGKRYGST